MKIGPFKHEFIHQDFEIGLFHDLISEKEALNIQNLSKGRTKSTPYITPKKGESLFSKVNMTEHLRPKALVVVERLKDLLG